MDALFTTEPIDQFKRVTQEVLNNLFESDEKASIDPSVVGGAKQEIRQLITDSNFEIDKVADTIKKRSWDQDKINVFITILQEIRTDLLNTLLAHSISTHGESLTNFNWVLKLVLGTSELKSLRYPLLQLVLNTKSLNGKEKQMMYEINKEVLGKMISVIEDIK